MANAVLEKAEVEVTRDPDTVEADMTIIRRHLRRKISCQWGAFDEDAGAYPVELNDNNVIFNGELAYRGKYDLYRFRFWQIEDHSNAVARRWDIAAKNPYVLCNEVIALVGTLRLKVALDLDKD